MFVFRGRRGDLVKLLWWTGDGLCLAKRPKRGRFIWPQASNGSVALTQLSMMLGGIDWQWPELTWNPTSDLQTWQGSRTWHMLSPADLPNDIAALKALQSLPR